LKTNNQSAPYFLVDGVTARRGGGSSGGRGGSAGSRSSSSRSSAARVSGRYSGSGYRSAIAAGFYVGGITRYRARFYGTSHYKAGKPYLTYLILKI